MEAMARARVVLAPAITGISELVTDGKSGFLYEPGSLKDFVRTIKLVDALMHARPAPRLEWIRHAARLQVLHNFQRDKNVARFCDRFLELAGARLGSGFHEDSVLQQIQRSVQRY
jgi:glycosyltransferase involved in cell wall biosynthesis